MSSEAPLDPILILISHASSPPLNPPPDLKYDLRSAPNPPKAIRDKCTGLDKRLREHLLAEEKFLEMLDRAERDIREAMEGVVERWKERGESAEVEKDEDDEEYEDSEGDGPVLRVGAFCAMGKHRSVAFVEELARKKWPWDVTVEHRDLYRSRDKKAKERGKALRYMNGGNDSDAE